MCNSCRNDYDSVVSLLKQLGMLETIETSRRYLLIQQGIVSHARLSLIPRRLNGGIAFRQKFHKTDDTLLFKSHTSLTVCND